MSLHEKGLGVVIECNGLTNIHHQIPVYVIIRVDFAREPGHQPGVRCKSKIPDFERGRRGAPTEAYK